jgi:hypothetical protein
LLVLVEPNRDSSVPHLHRVIQRATVVL